MSSTTAPLNWQDYYGLRFHEVKLPDAREVELTSTILRAKRIANIPETPVHGTVRVSGEGWHTVTLPWSAFAFEQANNAFLKYVKELTVAGGFTNGQPAKFQLRNVVVIKAPVISLEADVCGKSAPQNGVVEYNVTVGNCSKAKQLVSLAFVKHGWEEMTASVKPDSLEIAPGEIGTVKMRVQIPNRIPPGGHEEQMLQAIANGDASQATQLKFITTSEVPHPYLFHTPARWQEVRDKIAKYPWAKEQADHFIQRATDWRVPEIADPAKAPDDTFGPYVFVTPTENDLLAAGYAWQMTGNTQFAEKVALFMQTLERSRAWLSRHVARLQPESGAGGSFLPARCHGLRHDAGLEHLFRCGQTAD